MAREFTASEPGTFTQFVPRPAPRELVCTCKNQPVFSAGQFSVSVLPLTVLVSVGGVAAITLATVIWPGDGLSIFQVTNWPDEMVVTLLNVPL